MKGHDLSFTIPKPYLIGELSTIVIILLSYLISHLIINTNTLFIMAYSIFQIFW